MSEEKESTHLSHIDIAPYNGFVDSGGKKYKVVIEEVIPVKAKFEVGDSVWFTRLPSPDAINGVVASCKWHKMILYFIDVCRGGFTDRHWIVEDHVFKTRHEALSSLVGEDNAEKIRLIDTIQIDHEFAEFCEKYNLQARILSLLKSQENAINAKGSAKGE